MKEKVWLSSPHMGSNEIEFVKDAFLTNWIAPLGPHVDGFENDIQSYVKVSHAAVLSSGTAAIHLALIILGVEAGDEVLCQSFTFSGSANPIMYQGATPVFIGSEAETWNMCPNALEDAIKDRIRLGKKPKAIIPVHLYGMPAKMNEINSIALKYEIPVIEDAAEALGSHINGKMCGSFGELGVLSFNGNKIITTSGGGALLSKSREHIAQARFLSTQARDSAVHYQHSVVGYNYRMSNICAGIGRGQMEVLDERVSQRRANFMAYQNAFSEIPAIKFLSEPSGFFSNRWLTTVIVDSNNSNGATREDIRMALELENIESRPLWKPMHMQPVFKGMPFYGTTLAEQLFDNGLCLPSGSNLKTSDFDRIVSIIMGIFK
ncbi:MAG: aminotransferase class I/II-fold pyridoxal phosphate-dependent enzyme [Chitinophagales bacterium]|nr:aminotransferase class I/II-fold pyridoxal phosphate-dependent enzyme [Chitinophagales bacterium]